MVEFLNGFEKIKYCALMMLLIDGLNDIDLQLRIWGAVQTFIECTNRNDGVPYRGDGMGLLQNDCCPESTVKKARDIKG